MSIGPIQLIFCQLRDTEPGREMINHFVEIQGEGNIKVIDVQFVGKDDGGSLKLMEMSGFSPSKEIEFGSVIIPLISEEITQNEGELEGSAPGAWAAAEVSYGMNISDVREFIDQLAPGESAALFLIEHSWAAGFRDALSEVGGKMAAQGFLSKQALLKIGVEIEAQVEALNAAASSEESQRKAAMSALISSAASRAMQEETAMRAAEMMVEEELLEADAIDDAVRVVAEAIRIEEALNDESSSW